MAIQDDAHAIACGPRTPTNRGRSDCFRNPVNAECVPERPLWRGAGRRTYNFDERPPPKLRVVSPFTGFIMNLYSTFGSECFIRYKILLVACFQGRRPLAGRCGLFAPLFQNSSIQNIWHSCWP